MVNNFETYYRGFQDGANGVLNVLRSLLENGFGWVDAIEAAEEWIKCVQRNGGDCANTNDFFNQTTSKGEENEKT